MKIVAWISGVGGILVSLIGLGSGLMGAVTVDILGRPHAPSTFITLGTLLLAVGIWASVVVNPKKE